MHLRKFFAATAISLALAAGTAAQSVPDAGGTTTPAPKKGSQKKANPRSKRKSKKQKGAPAPLKSVVEEKTRKAPESTSSPSVTAPAANAPAANAPAAKPPAGEAAAAPVAHDPPVLPHIPVEDEKRGVVKQEEPAPPATVMIKPTAAPPPAVTPTEEKKGVRFTEIHARRVGETEGAPGAGIAPAMAKANAPVESPGRNTLIGIGLDAGAPGGGGLTLLVRPLWWLRLNGGVSYNYAGFGFRGGVSLSPCWCVVTPTLNLDAGHYLSGDLNKFVTVTDPFEKKLLSDTTYTFATAQIGLEFGSQRWFTFYLRGGLAYVRHSFSGTDLTALAQNKITNDPSTTYQIGDGKVTAVLPGVSLGFNIFVY